MARFAPVVPLQLARFLKQSAKGDFLGGYHLLLAHDILDHPKEYVEVYGDVREKYPDAVIIIDNSIIELGKALGMAELVKASQILWPDCIVIPDVMGKGEETRQGAAEFIKTYYRYGVDNQLRLPGLLGVIQGEDVADQMKTFRLYDQYSNVTHLSVPRVITAQMGSRMPLVARLYANASTPVHLLGFSDDILDDIACARMPNVIGIDSAVPVRAGLQGQLIDLNSRGGFKQNFGPRGNFWERAAPDGGAVHAWCVLENLSEVRRWIVS